MTVPEQIGRYRIEREIGRGGMAVVYLATDPTMNRHVAVKILPRHFSFDPAFQERFRREVEIIAGLEHPSIVPVYDFGVYDQQPFLVMRFMSGGSLGSKLQKGALSPEQANLIIRPIAEALDKAHRRNIIHRDVKPDNVLFDEDEQPYLSDFGVARLVEGTQTMTIVGTPSYISPEQAQGDMQIDGRSDIYSLGVMLFEILSGQSPYQADTPVKLMMKHVLEPIPDILSVNPDLPHEFRSIIYRAMAKDPAERFDTATEMVNAVSAIATGNTIADVSPLAVTVLDAPPTRSSENQVQASPSKDNSGKRSIPKSLAILAAVILLFGAVGGAWYLSGLGPSPNEGPQDGGTNPTNPVMNADATQTESARIIATQSAMLTTRPDEQQSTPSPTVLPPTGTPTLTATPSSTPSATPTQLVVIDLTSFADVSVSEYTPPGLDTCGDSVTYGPRHLVDGQENTAWRVQGDGRNASAQFDFGREINLTSLEVLPGYDKRDPCNPNIYWCSKYRIPSQILLTTSDGTSMELELINDCTWQYMEFEPIQTSYLKLRIMNSYPRREDHFADYTAISEVKLLGSR